ncbi:glycosyltransferase, partial [Pelomicrobium sp. G1]|uniref:glycosyltransferase n=1 Tax=Pelomicrobium sp. G1 TaxID=3452920 RepID=UPI003F76E4F6
LLLMGGGFQEEALKRQAQALGLMGRVIFAGRVPHAEVGRYYDLVDILVYPRRSIRLTELVTPLKTLEALAQGKLVVASDV